MALEGVKEDKNRPKRQNNGSQDLDGSNNSLSRSYEDDKNSSSSSSGQLVGSGFADDSLNDSNYSEIESNIAKEPEQRMSTTNGLLEATSSSPDVTDNKLLVDN